MSDYSRKEVKRLLKSAHIQVNGETVQHPALHIEDIDVVTVYGTPLDTPAPRYFMLNKPKDTICATTDSMHPTVMDLLQEPNSDKLHIAGRLDKDTTGLVLITDDGQWSHRITAPSQSCTKIYRVKIDEPLSEEAKQQLTQGIVLRNENKPTRPAVVSTIGATHIELSISEGKYHQVKRMLAAVGNHVNDLHRLSIGGISLDPELALGEYRALTPDEITAIEQ